VERFLEAGALLPGFKAHAHYSRSIEKAQLFSRRFQMPLAFDSLIAMAESKQIDAVYIASPNVFHAEQAIIFLERGIPVLCEKALAVNSQQVRDMIHAAKTSGVTLMEAMRTTVGPNFLAVKAALPQLGTIRRYTASYCQYSSRYDDFRRGLIHNAFDPAMGGGALMDIGVYTLFPLIALFGVPNSVQAQQTILANGIDGQGSVICQYPQMLASMHYSKITNSNQISEIQGEEATIRINAINLFTQVELVDRQGHSQEISKPYPLNDMVFEITEFMDCVRLGKVSSDLNSWEFSLSVIEVMDKIRALGKA
jgi:predicted dehydrogenase